LDGIETRLMHRINSVATGKARQPKPSLDGLLTHPVPYLETRGEPAFVHGEVVEEIDNEEVDEPLVED